MATLITAATGNFTTLATWLVADSAAELDSEAANTATTTSYVASSAFTSGAITINAIAVKVLSRSASPTGTFSVELYNSTLGASVTNTETTVDVADLPLSGGWVVFPTNGNVLLLAATNYQVRVKSSTSSQVTLYRNSTSNNWSRQLRTTTAPGSLATGDKLIIAGEHTGSGTGNSFTVTMDNTATTSFGATSMAQSITVSKRATLDWGTAASTNYYLKWKGVFKVWDSGTVNVGTSGTRMPSTSTAVLEMDSAANVDTGLIIGNGSTFNSYAATKAVIQTTLDADEAAAQTVIGAIGSTVGWANGDELAFASTTTTASQTEKKTISTVDSGTQVTLTAGLTNAHSGTAPTKCEIINLTRNVRFRGISSSLNGYIVIEGTSTVVFNYTEVYNMGSFTTDKRGIDIKTTTGSCTFQFCSIHDFTQPTAIGFAITGSTSSNITIDNNVMYNFNNNAINVATTTGTWTITANVIMGIGSGGGSAGVVLGDVGGTFTNNTIVGAQSQNGLTLSEVGGTIGSIAVNTFHSNSGYGIAVTAVISGTIGSITAWRNSTANIGITAAGDLIINSATCFGGSSANMDISNAGGEVQLNSATFNGGVTTVSPVGIRFQGPTANFKANSCSFGGATAHTTGDLQVTSSLAGVYAKFNNCTFASSTEISQQSSLLPASFIGSSKHDAVGGTHKMWRKYGTLIIDTTIFDVTPSLRMTPSSATGKLESLPIRVACTSGSAVTISVKVRESVSGDGTDYNGNRIRLIVKRNDAVGITSDTVLATATASSEGAFEVISGVTASPSADGVLEFIVDCDGTTGWINVDTMSATPVADTRGYKYWADGSPVVYGDNAISSVATLSTVF